MLTWKLLLKLETTVAVCKFATRHRIHLILVDCDGLKWSFNWLYMLSYLSAHATTVTCLTCGFVAFHYGPVGYRVECCETNAAVRHSPVSYFLAPIDLVRAA